MFLSQCTYSFFSLSLSPDNSQLFNLPYKSTKTILYGERREVFLHSFWCSSLYFAHSLYSCLFLFLFLFFFSLNSNVVNVSSSEIEGAKRIIIWLEKTHVVISENISNSYFIPTDRLCVRDLCVFGFVFLFFHFSSSSAYCLQLYRFNSPIIYTSIRIWYRSVLGVQCSHICTFLYFQTFTSIENTKSSVPTSMYQCWSLNYCAF